MVNRHGAPDVGDYETGKTRLLARQCSTCVLRPGDAMRLGPGRLRQFIAEARDRESFIICHATLPAMAPPGYPGPAVCRGFYDRFSTITLRLIAALWGFIEINPPEVTR